jgi:hypothetical protein
MKNRCAGHAEFGMTATMPNAGDLVDIRKNHSVQTAENAGNRTGQVALSIEF